MLQINNIKKYYDTQKAVDGISFSIGKGEIFGLLGPNGAGKSSLLRMVTGITMPDSGEIFFDGDVFNPVKHSRYIGYMPEERGLYKKMKVGEHAIYLASLKGLNSVAVQKKVKYWFDKLDMNTWWNKKVEDLSKGMSQKLQFVTTVVHDPKLLILDEPFSGLDPVNSKIIKDEIEELAKNGTTIIFSTHRMEQVEEICQQIVLMNKGVTVLEGNVHAIKQRYKEYVYELVLEETVEHTLPATIIEKQDSRFILKLENKEEQHVLLQFCLKHNYTILRFNELLPTLNDIFINLVEGKAVTQFQ